MARPLGIQSPRDVNHVTSRENGRNKIFSDDQDWEIFFFILSASMNDREGSDKKKNNILMGDPVAA
jgi:hypothetical protein